MQNSLHNFKTLSITRDNLLNKYITEFDNIVNLANEKQDKTKLEQILIDVILPDFLEIVEKESKLLNREIKKIKIKFASVDDKNRIVVDKDSKEFKYTIENALELEQAIQELYDEIIVVNIDNLTYEVLVKEVESVKSVREKLFLNQLIKNIT